MWIKLTSIAWNKVVVLNLLVFVPVSTKKSFSSIKEKYNNQKMTSIYIYYVY